MVRPVLGKATVLSMLRGNNDNQIYMPVPGQIFGQTLGKYTPNCAVVLFGKFYFDTFRSNFGSLKRLMEGKKFSVDVKCKDPVLVSFDGSIIFVSNKHPQSDKSFMRRVVVVVCADRACADMEEIWVITLRKRWAVGVVEEEEDVIDLGIGNRQQS